VALSLFTVIPAGVGGRLDEGAAARAVFWLPVLGAGLGLAGSAVMVFVAAGDLSPERQFLGAALAVALLAIATGGLHLDGLADTADGLGSRRPADQALEIMRRSDAGPLGVAALVLVLLVQVSALASLPHGWTGGGWTGASWLVLAAVTSRVAAVLATGSPSARPSGFGALVAGRTSAAGRAVSVAVLLAAVIAGGLALGGVAAAARGLLAAVAGLAAAALLRLAARRRLGGMTGDVFGAVIELSTATVLLVLVLAR
jgi:adenosylcobinamide-GDP ribazoletransferase